VRFIFGVLTLSIIVTPPISFADQADFSSAARKLAQDSMIVDTHIDVPGRVMMNWVDVSKETDDGDFDYQRARRGGLDIPFMSIYTPATAEQEGRSYALANQLIDSVEAMVGRAPGKFALVSSTQDAEKAMQRGLMGLALGMENGSPIDGKLENLAFFHGRGISYITLVHSLSNHISDSSYDEERQWDGLSPFGKEVVTEMNRLGIMIDISHVSDEAFWQVLELSATPVIASHSSARHFTPGFERNMSDEMIVALAKAGGVMQINFGSSFLTKESRDWSDVMKEARKAFLKENGFDEDGSEAKNFSDNYRVKHPFPFATLDDLLAHFQHVIELVGVEHVGIGSDFDGVGDSLPEGMKDVSFYPYLIERLLKLEYSTQDIKAILGGNLMRVWREVENYTEKQVTAYSRSLQPELQQPGA
jgi:membrane dipeptidase